MKVRLVVFLVLLFSFVLGACAPAIVGAAEFVDLPEGVELQIVGVVVALVGFLFMKAIELIPWLRWLEEYREPLALALAAELIALLENALPSAYPDISLLAVQLLLAILASFGFFRVWRKRGFRLFR